jgi:hypothetical protein
VVLGMMVTMPALSLHRGQLVKTGHKRCSRQPAPGRGSNYRLFRYFQWSALPIGESRAPPSAYAASRRVTSIALAATPVILSPALLYLRVRVSE